MAKKVKPQVGFEWDVQPYQFLKELRANYTQTVIIAVQRRSETIADEAEEWMRQNAPWQDKNIYEGRGEDKVLKYPAGTARKGLRVQVLKDDEEVARYEAGKAAAQNKDAELLDQLTREARERREDATIRVGRYLHGSEAKRYTVHTRRRSTGEIVSTRYVDVAAVAPQPEKAYRLKRAIRTQKQYKRPYRVPKSRSAVAQFEKEWKGQRSPVIRVLFRHNTRLPYVLWLEIANQGRYAIIARALQHWGRILMGEVRSLANLKQYRDRIAFGAGRTPRERFEKNAAAYEAFEGRPYRPWTPERQARKIKRRSEYDPEAVKQAAEYKKQQAERKAPQLRTYVEQKPENTMRLYPPSGRR